MTFVPATAVPSEIQTLQINQALNGLQSFYLEKSGRVFWSRQSQPRIGVDGEFGGPNQATAS